MKRRRSGKKLVLAIFFVMLTVAVLCLTVCGGYAIYSSMQDMMTYNQAALDLYLNDLVHAMKDLQDFSEDLFANDLDFAALSFENRFVSPAQRMQEEFSLRRMIQNRTQGIAGILLFEAGQGTNDYWFGSDFLGGRVDAKTIGKMRAVRSLWLSDEAPAAQRWVSYTDGECMLLMNMFRQRNLYLCAMVDVQAYAAMENRPEDIEYAFLTRDRILTNAPGAEENGVLLKDMLSAVDGTLFKKGSVIVQSRFNEEMGIGLCGMISLASVWEHLRVYVILLAAALLFTCGLFVSMYHFLKQMLISPLDQITDATRQIEAGAASIQSEPKPIRELMEIQTALEKLVEQKVTLAKENLLWQNQKEHALLQYYQLQTRSHFFLNCLKSIHGLTVQGERERTIAIIGMFSNHLRYVFHDSLTFVTVQAELDEVRDYFGIIEAERSDHILLQQDIQPDLLDFPVPPLIIQTFLENFNKHNAQSGKILRFGIHIDSVELEEDRYVRIRMTDNGVGYSEEALQSLQNRDGLFEQYHVGVQNLCRRMDILYHGQYKKAFFNGPGGGAVSTFYLPVPTENAPKHGQGPEAEKGENAPGRGEGPEAKEEEKP